VAGSAFPVKGIVGNHPVIGEAARFGKICVSIYAFISGYGLWTQYKQRCVAHENEEVNDSKALIRSVLLRLRKFYLVYWPFVFVGAAVTFWQKGIFSGAELLKTLVGLSWSYNAAWWYVRYYLLMIMILYPLSIFVHKVISKIGGSHRITTWIMVVSMSVVCVMVGARITGALCLPVFIMGELCAENDWICKIRNSKKLTLLLFVAGLCVRMLYTNDSGALTLDLLCVPAMIPAVLILCEKIEGIGKALSELGKHSASMWLMHSFLYSGWGWPSKVPSAILGFILILSLSYLVAVIWDGAYEHLRSKISKTIEKMR
jgi:hypothetical protein